MNDQMRLNVRPGDPATSHAAAAPNRDTIKGRVYSLHLDQSYYRNGLTDSELTARYTDTYGRCHPGSLSKRRGELVSEGRLRDSGERRLSQFGHQQIVWEINQ